MGIIGSVTRVCECGKRYLICPAVEGVEVHECIENPLIEVKNKIKESNMSNIATSIMTEGCFSVYMRDHYKNHGDHLVLLGTDTESHAYEANVFAVEEFGDDMKVRLLEAMLHDSYLFLSFPTEDEAYNYFAKWNNKVVGWHKETDRGGPLVTVLKWYEYGKLMGE